jgi:hypothetical protein
VPVFDRHLLGELGDFLAECKREPGEGAGVVDEWPGVN